MQNLPSELNVEILLRLPVKSLCRFKCVCKSWCSLISHPKFTRRHVSLALIDKDIEHQRRKLILQSCSLSSMYYVEYEAMAANHVMAVKLDIPFKMSSLDKVGIIGSFNGLLCISLKPERLFLFNPTINEAKKVPNLHTGKGHHSSIARPSIYGFGYDPSLDDYKVVKIVYDHHVYVYSLKTDTWRRAQDFPYHSLSSDPGVPMNGAVHWVFARGKHSIGSRPRLIVAFDFAEGKFREMPPPSDYIDADNLTTIGALGGCLCWLTRSIGTAMKELYHFWVMKEYGVNESWTKVVINIPFHCLRPLSFLKNDEALLEIDGKLVLYNPREATHRELVIHGKIHGGRELGIQTYAYVESLVSPTLWQWELEEI